MIGVPTYDAAASQDPNYSKQYANQMETWRSGAFDEATRNWRLSDECTRIQEYINMLQGDYWSRSRPKFLSRFYSNRLAETRYAKLSLLTDIRPTISVSSSVPAFQEQASIADSLIRAEWTKNDVDLSLAQVIDASLLFGNGFWKISSSKPGYTRFQQCGPDVVMPIQPGYDMQSSAAVLYRTYKPISYFQRLWPERSVGLEREASTPDQHQGTTVMQRPPQVSEFTWNSLSPQMKYKLGLRVGGKIDSPSANSYPTIELQEYWVDDQSLNLSKEEVIVKDPYLPIEAHNYWYKVQPMQRLYPRKRLIVFAGKRLMYDGPSPYWHGLYPFAMLRLNPVIWSFWGVSKYRNLVPLNKAINEIGAGSLDIVKRTLNPQLIAKEGAIAKDAFERFFPNMPGGKLKVNNNFNPMTDIRYMDPPVLPQSVFETMQFVTAEFDRMSGSVDTGSLAGKGQVPGGESIEAMRDLANPAVRLEGRYIEAFLRDSGTQVISNIFQFYTRGQRLRILGENGLTWSDFDYKPEKMMCPDGEVAEDHWRNFSMDIAQGSLLGSNKVQEAQAAMSLFKINGISRKAMLRQLGRGAEADQIEQEIKEEVDAGISALSQKEGTGRTPRLTRGARNGEMA